MSCFCSSASRPGQPQNAVLTAISHRLWLKTRMARRSTRYVPEEWRKQWISGQRSRRSPIGAVRQGMEGRARVAGASQTGIALVLVLWILSLLAVIASSFVFSTRTDTFLTANLVGLARAEALADAGVQRALYALLKPSADPAVRWKGDGQMHLWEYEGEVIRITLRSESAKIDINNANPELIKGLLRNAGVDGQALEGLLDAMQDWRDADDLRRPNGAEKEDYAAAGKTHGPANSNFQTIDELRQVLGMNDAVYRRIAGQITVYSGQAGINSSIAGRDVLLAIPGVDPAAVDAYIASRNLPPGQLIPIFPSAQAFSAGDGNVFSIVSDVKLSDNSRFIREAVVRVEQNPKQPVTVLAWRSPAARLATIQPPNENMQYGKQ